MPERPVFGRVLSAMVTPMRADSSLDLDAAATLATHLVDAGHDGLVVSGTTGEAPTTTDEEKVELLHAVLGAVGDRARVVAGVGTNDTAHTVELARQAADAGAHGLLVVTPYYSKPPQEGLVAHFTTVADATELPVMLYDIPGRAGIPIRPETLLRLAEHPRIRAVKDAKADYWAATKVLSATDLLWYSGDDAANLYHFANGAHGIVGVTSQVAPRPYAAMVAAAVDGDLDRARALHRMLVPLVEAVMTITQGAIMAKAGLVATGVIDSLAVRLPLVEATASQRDALEKALAETDLT